MAEIGSVDATGGASVGGAVAVGDRLGECRVEEPEMLLACPVEARDDL